MNEEQILDLQKAQAFVAIQPNSDENFVNTTTLANAIREAKGEVEAGNVENNVLFIYKLVAIVKSPSEAIVIKV